MHGRSGSDASLARLAQEPGSASGETRGGGGLGPGAMAVKKTEKRRTHFTFRIDTWTADGESIVEHLAGVEDYTLAMATYRSCDRTLANTDHVAAGRPRDRGQPAPTSGVTKAGRPGVKPRSGLP